jgi:hypothetical protein
MNRLIVVLLFLSVVGSAKGQNEADFPFSADRPGMAWSADLLSPRKFQFESGFSFERSGRGDNRQDYILFNTSMLRYGVSRHAEIRIIGDVAQQSTPGNTITGLNPLVLGTKIMVFKGRGLLPKTSVLMHMKIPYTGKKEFRPQRYLPSIYLAFQNKITDRMGLCYNVGVDYNDETDGASEFFGLCFGFNLTERLYSFIETYNYFEMGVAPVNSVDVGFAYQVSDNIQIDLSGNMNLQNFKQYFAINCGVAWRIVRNHAKAGSAR